ncbi:MAG: hypothetical protein M3N21_08855 [Actinomycetota bacterium]|nr:hypothetical protein [Actinomycetota bacterium]
MPPRHPLDVLAQTWMMVGSRRMNAREAPWLIGPTAGSDVVGHGWVDSEAARCGGTTSRGADHGLLPSFRVLRGVTFDPGEVDERIVDFYEHTSRWSLDLWSEWSPLAWPFGRLITALFSHRLQQLSLPMRPLDVSFGMDSEVIHVHDSTGALVGAAWQRTMRKTGDHTYSGLYGAVTLPGSEQPSVRVVFPLPIGNLPVFLRPSAGKAGDFHLRSPHGAFGEEGAYLVLHRKDGTINVRRIPIHEHFHLFVDDAGDLRCDHYVKLWDIPGVRLHYRMRRQSPGGA